MFLNRVLSSEFSGIWYEPDPRHAEIILAQLGLNSQSSRAVSTPGVTATAIRSEDDAENPFLPPSEASAYRGLATRTNFLAQDRVDLQYASKELSRWMSAPRRSDWEPMKRLGRYLLTSPRATLFFEWQRMPTEILAFSDTDWAVCKISRRSTSGGMIFHGKHMIRSWSRAQNLVALSSAEAELYGTVRASGELLGIRSLARDFGHFLRGRLYADASAALGIIHRQGLGKLRHLDTNALWVQQAARMKLIEFLKILGTDNPADMLTKHLPEEPRSRHAARVGVQFLQGRPAIAPHVCADEANTVEKEKHIPASAAPATREPSGKGIGSPLPCASWADAADAEDPESGCERTSRMRHEHPDL